MHTESRIMARGRDKTRCWTCTARCWSRVGVVTVPGVGHVPRGVDHGSGSWRDQVLDVHSEVLIMARGRDETRCWTCTARCWSWLGVVTIPSVGYVQEVWITAGGRDETRCWTCTARCWSGLGVVTTRPGVGHVHEVWITAGGGDETRCWTCTGGVDHGSGSTWGNGLSKPSFPSSQYVFCWPLPCETKEGLPGSCCLYLLCTAHKRIYVSF